jgi:hypothetical protein
MKQVERQRGVLFEKSWLLVAVGMLGRAVCMLGKPRHRTSRAIGKISELAGIVGPPGQKVPSRPPLPFDLERGFPMAAHFSQLLRRSVFSLGRAPLQSRVARCIEL